MYFGSLCNMQVFYLFILNPFSCYGVGQTYTRTFGFIILMWFESWHLNSSKPVESRYLLSSSFFVSATSRWIFIIHQNIAQLYQLYCMAGTKLVWRADRFTSAKKRPTYTFCSTRESSPLLLTPSSNTLKFKFCTFCTVAFLNCPNWCRIHHRKILVWPWTHQL